MLDIFSNCGIEVSLGEEKNYTKSFKYRKVLNGLGTHDYLYFYEAINLLRKEHKLPEIAIGEDIFFSSSNNKNKWLFVLKKESEDFVLMGNLKGAINHIVKNVFVAFDNKNRDSIDEVFNEGKLAFVNNYMSQQYGLQNLEQQIEEAEKSRASLIKDTFSFQFPTDESSKEFKSILDMAMGRNKYETYEIMLYVMSVFSFIEHAAILVLPFWFAMNEEKPLWKDFCKGFRTSTYDTFKDFWTTKINWIDSFIETLCCFHRFCYKYPDGNFSDATEDEQSLKLLYDRLRKDFRNPIHHGLSTDEFKTGLSMEVPSLEKKVLFNAPPLMREINMKTFYDVRRFLKLFLSILKKKNPQIVKYLESELNVPVDCSELKKYVIDGNMQDFLRQYEQLEAHACELM